MKNNFDLTLLEERNKVLLENLNQLKGQSKLLTQQLAEIEIKLSDYANKRVVYTKSVELLTVVQKMTRDKIKKGFENIVTYALKSIFNDDYKFILDFGKRGNLQTVDFKIITPNRKEANDPMDSEGGGILDVVSFALRIALMELSKPKIEGFICLDESFKHVSSNYLENVKKFIKAINQKVKRQIILVTHQDTFMSIDNIIKIDKELGRKAERQTEKGGRKK